MRAARRLLATATLAALVAVGLLGGFSGCSLHADSTVVAAVPLPDLTAVGLKQLWERQVRLDPGERVKKAWRVGESVYLATTQSRLARVNARSGVLMWYAGLGQENFDIYRPIELKPADGPAKDVLVVTRGEAFLFSMETGEFRREPNRVGLSVSCNPIVAGNTLCVGGAGKFFGLYLDRPGSIHWRVTQPGDLFDSAPVAIENSVVVASNKGRLWRINTDTGDWVWKDRKTNGDVIAGLAADDHAVYVPCLDQRVYAFASDSGSELWEQQLAGVLSTTPVLGGNVITVISETQGMYALSRQTGEIKWHVADIWQTATVGETSIWTGTREGTLKNLSLETGEELATASAPGVEFFVRNTEDQNLVLVTRSGLIGMYTKK